VCVCVCVRARVCVRRVCVCLVKRLCTLVGLGALVCCLINGGNARAGMHAAAAVLHPARAGGIGCAARVLSTPTPRWLLSQGCSCAGRWVQVLTLGASAAPAHPHNGHSDLSDLTTQTTRDAGPAG